MSYYIKTLRQNGNDIAPRTTTKAIVDDDGNSLDTTLGRYVTVANDAIPTSALGGVGNAPAVSAGGGITRVQLHVDPETGLLEKTPQEILNDYWENGIEYWFYDMEDVPFACTGQGGYVSVYDGDYHEYDCIVFQSIWFHGHIYENRNSPNTYGTDETYYIYDGEHSIYHYGFTREFRMDSNGETAISTYPFDSYPIET